MKKLVEMVEMVDQSCKAGLWGNWFSSKRSDPPSHEGTIPQAQRSSTAFTLIELLVVISVIGILAALLLVRFGAVEKSARDTQRKSDLNQYRTALENYAVSHGGMYPATNVNLCANEDLCGTGGPLVAYMSQCPQDPLFAGDCSGGSGGRIYDYAPSLIGDKYILYVWGGLEAQTGKTWVVCWDGKVGVVDNNWSAVTAFCPI